MGLGGGDPAGGCWLSEWLIKVCFPQDIFIHIICFSNECNLNKNKFRNGCARNTLVLSIKMMYCGIIIPFIRLESTLVAVTATAALGSFRVAAILPGF